MCSLLGRAGGERPTLSGVRAGDHALAVRKNLHRRSAGAGLHGLRPHLGRDCGVARPRDGRADDRDAPRAPEGTPRSGRIRLGARSSQRRGMRAVEVADRAGGRREAGLSHPASGTLVPRTGASFGGAFGTRRAIGGRSRAVAGDGVRQVDRNELAGSFPSRSQRPCGAARGSSGIAGMVGKRRPLVRSAAHGRSSTHDGGSGSSRLLRRTGRRIAGRTGFPPSSGSDHGSTRRTRCGRCGGCSRRRGSNRRCSRPLAPASARVFKEGR